MRIFSNNVKFLLETDEVSIFWLVQLATPAATYRDTTAAMDMVVPSVGTFLAGTGLLVVEAPRLSKSVDRETFKVTYIDPEFEKRALFETGLTGSEMTVYVGFFNTTQFVLGGAQPGEPLLNTEDLIIAYEGVVDTQGYSIDPDEATVIAVVEGSSPMATLNLTRSFFTSKEEIQQVNPADTCFDQVSIPAHKTSYLWGKA